MSKDDQKILVIKTSDIFPHGIQEGFLPIPKEELFNLIDKYGEYKRRGDVEEDENYQQIIAQIVLKVEKKIFIHRIPGSGGESRLHDLWPIFLGGHVEQSDLSIVDAMEREFSEELNYHGNIINKKYIGIIKLHDNPVNKVHLGLVWIFTGDDEDFESTKDDGVVDGKFVDIKELKVYEDKMTYWSKLFYPYLLKI
jgi:predicted NUDIX family phosphoesterase